MGLFLASRMNTSRYRGFSIYGDAATICHIFVKKEFKIPQSYALLVNRCNHVPQCPLVSRWSVYSAYNFPCVNFIYVLIERQDSKIWQLLLYHFSVNSEDIARMVLLLKLNHIIQVFNVHLCQALATKSYQQEYSFSLSNSQFL